MEFKVPTKDEARQRDSWGPTGKANWEREREKDRVKDSDGEREWGGGSKKERVQPLYLNYQALLWQAYNCPHISCQATLPTVRLIAYQPASIPSTCLALRRRQEEADMTVCDDWLVSHAPLCHSAGPAITWCARVERSPKVTQVNYVNSSASESCHYIIHETASAWQMSDSRSCFLASTHTVFPRHFPFTSDIKVLRNIAFYLHLSQHMFFFA